MTTCLGARGHAGATAGNRAEARIGQLTGRSHPAPAAWGDIWLVAVVALATRVAIILLAPSGQTGDMVGWVATAQRVAADGVQAGYGVLDPGSLYPPAFFYPLWLTGKLYTLCCSPAFATDTHSLDVLMRVGPVVADAALAVLVYCLALAWSGPSRARWAGLLYALNPAVLATVAWQGMIGDAYYASLLVLALLCVLRGQVVPSAVCLTLAVLVKPQALAFVPLLGFLLLTRATAIQLLVALVASAVAVVLVMLPFVVHGALGDVAAALPAMGALHANTQNHADNVWLLLPVWRGAVAADPNGAVPDNTVLVAGLTYLAVGLLAFAALYAGVLVRLVRGGTARDVAFAAAIIGLGFFFLNTRMHVNYVFLAFPFLCALAPSGGSRVRLALGAVTLACLVGWDVPSHLPWLVHRANAVLYGGSLALLCALAFWAPARRARPGRGAPWQGAAASAARWTRSAGQLHHPELRSQSAAQGDTSA